MGDKLFKEGTDRSSPPARTLKDWVKTQVEDLEATRRAALPPKQYIPIPIEIQEHINAGHTIKLLIRKDVMSWSVNGVQKPYLDVRFER